MKNTSCRGLMLLGAVESRGAFVVGILDVILGCGEFEVSTARKRLCDGNAV